MHVGNIMVESLMKYYIQKNIRTTKEDYILVELHRQENDRYMEQIMGHLDKVASKVVWVKHPRYNCYKGEHITFLPPQGYVDMCRLVDKAKLLITDSGGLQVDSTYLGTPCMTLRERTEWGNTVSFGTNTLCSVETFLGNWTLPEKEADQDKFKAELWDDKVSERILNVLKEV
jgi:UDP-N-acetylglucosamine 2-epimerase (non-hydrolysing)